MDPYRVLTLGREFGCGSGDIAARLAQHLGWKLFDRELIDEIARIAHLEPGECQRTDERVDSWLHRVGKGLWNSTGDKAPALIPDSTLDADAMASLAHRVIEDLAAVGGCIIVGRGANYILRARPDAFHVFLYASPSWRIHHLEAQGQPHATALVQHMDRERALYIRRYFNADWPDRRLYHLMLDAALGPERTASTVLTALGAN